MIQHPTIVSALQGLAPDVNRKGQAGSVATKAEHRYVLRTFTGAGAALHMDHI